MYTITSLGSLKFSLLSWFLSSVLQEPVWPAFAQFFGIFFFFTDMKASNGRPLGNNYKMFPSNRADNGVIYSIPLTKTRSDTLIRISLVTSFRAYKWALWRVLIDGQPCKSPRNIQSAQHQSDRGDTVTPGTVAGVCKATRRGRIGKGKHTIAITIINKVRDDLITGWHGSSMLEAQEIVMP